MQKKKLYDHQKQAHHTGQAGVQQVLPVLQEAHDTQGNQITTRFTGAICKGFLSDSAD
jgi:hypothetical protein